MFNKDARFDREMYRAEKSARAFAERNKKEARKIEKMLSRNTGISYSPNSKGSISSETLQFFIGFLLLGGGLYWLLNSFTVVTTMGGMGGIGRYSFFGMRITGGVMLIPLLIGIGLIFFLNGKKRCIGYSVAALGLFIIVISLLSSLDFRPRYGNTLYVYVLIFSMIAAGAALIIKSNFKKKS